jgi:hypothetical protein
MTTTEPKVPSLQQRHHRRKSRMRYRAATTECRMYLRNLPYRPPRAPQHSNLAATAQN